MRARLGRCCVILIFFFSPSGSHFGATGGAFLGYMESPPGLLPFTVGAWGAFFCVIWLQPARRLEMRKSSHSVAFSLYCTMSGGQLIMLVKRIICDLMISNASTHWPSFIVHTLSGACLASTSDGSSVQKEAPNSGYRVTDSDERARSVTERRQYHRVVPGRPHNAQTSTHWPSFIVNTLWSVSRFNVQTAPEGGSEQRISRHGVG